MTARLFVYGSLAPGRRNAHVLADVPGTWQAATVRGTLFQEGWGAALGYPGIVLDERGDEVHGLVFSSDDLPTHWNRLDAFEGEGYERVAAIAELEDGTRVEACVYALSRAALARMPTGAGMPGKPHPTSMGGEMSTPDPRPPIWIGHVVLESERVEATAGFMAKLGLRTIFSGPAMAIFELRGGTHLLVFPKGHVPGGAGTFDLMVDDLEAFRAQLVAAALEPSGIESVPAMHHERFTVREPGGNVLTFYSSHASGQPV